MNPEDVAVLKQGVGDQSGYRGLRGEERKGTERQETERESLMQLVIFNFPSLQGSYYEFHRVWIA